MLLSLYIYVLSYICIQTYISIHIYIYITEQPGSGIQWSTPDLHGGSEAFWTVCIGWVLGHQFILPEACLGRLVCTEQVSEVNNLIRGPVSYILMMV